MFQSGFNLSVHDFGFDGRWVFACAPNSSPQPKLIRLGMPKIPANFSKCIFYLFASPEAAEENTNLGGTGFLIGKKSVARPNSSFIFAVTNWHVAVRDNFPTIRLNKRDGTAGILDIGPDQWFFESPFRIGLSTSQPS